MKEQAQPLKPIPIIATKATIYKMYVKLPVDTVRRAIHYAIETVNDESRIKYTKSIKTLNSKHIAIIISELGAAPGYVSLNE
jgi:hypothetical protein